MPTLNLDSATPDEIAAWMTEHRVTSMTFTRDYVHPAGGFAGAPGSQTLTPVRISHIELAAQAFIEDAMRKAKAAAEAEAAKEQDVVRQDPKPVDPVDVDREYAKAFSPEGRY